jgi:hypothetical protein
MSSPLALSEKHHVSVKVEVPEQGFCNIDKAQDWQITAIAAFLSDVLKKKFVEIGNKKLMFKIIDPDTNLIKCWNAMSSLQCFHFRYSFVSETATSLD